MKNLIEFQRGKLNSSTLIGVPDFYILPNDTMNFLVHPIAFISISTNSFLFYRLHEQVSFKPERGLVLRYMSDQEAAEYVIPPFQVGTVPGKGPRTRFPVMIHLRRIFYSLEAFPSVSTGLIDVLVGMSVCISELYLEPSRAEPFSSPLWSRH